MSPGRLRDPSRRPVVGSPAPDAPSAPRDAPVRGSSPTPDTTPATGGTSARHDAPTPGVAATPGDVTDTPETTGPLAGRTVLLPRSVERAAPLAERLRGLGAEVLVAPAIERAPIEDTAPVDAAVRALADGRFSWVVVTSVNAIDELVASAARLDVSLGSLGSPPDDAAAADPGVRWAAVGPATARTLGAVGVNVTLVPEENSAQGLVAAFAARPDRAERGAGRVLLPQGDLARPTMADGLRDLGLEPTVVTVYRTVAHELPAAVVHRWRAGEVDAVVLTSGSVAREVARQLGPRADVAGVAIGEPTARAACAVGLRLDAVAARATDDALADALVTVLSDSARPRDHAPSDTREGEAP